MQDKMAQVLVVVAILTPIVAALVEAIKRGLFGEETRWVPLVSIVVGIVAGIATSYLLAESLRLMVLAGAIAGLAASGLYKAVTAIRPQ